MYASMYTHTVYTPTQKHMIMYMHTLQPHPPTHTHTQAQQPTFSSLESWLEHLGLSRHLKMLHDHGVSQVFQLSGITEEVSTLYSLNSMRGLRNCTKETVQCSVYIVSLHPILAIKILEKLN